MAGLMHQHAREGWARLLPPDLRRRVLLIALVPLVPFVLLLIGDAVWRASTTGADALRTNRQTARRLVERVDGYMADLRRQSHTLATAIGTRGQPNWGWTNRLLTDTAADNPTLRSLSWVSSYGSVPASSRRAAIGTTVRPPVAQPWAVSDLQPAGPISGAVSLVATYALQGSLVAEIDPDRLGALLNGQGVAAVFDRQGRLVASVPPRQGTWAARTAWRDSDPLLRRALATGGETHGTVTFATFDAPFYAVYTPTATGFIVGALQPRGAARAASVRAVLRDVLLLALVLAVVGYGVYRLAGTIVDPMRGLLADAPTLPDTAPEEMRTLHARMADTTAERRRLWGILDALPVGVRVVNAAGEVVLANPAARDTLGEDALGMQSTPRGRYTLHRPDGTPLPLAEVPLVQALHASEASRNREIVIRYANGDGLLLLISAVPAMDGVVETSVEVVSDTATLQEIRTTTHLEVDLATVSGQLAALLEILPAGVIFLDTQGQIIRANGEAARLWGGMLPAVTTVADFRFLTGWSTRTNEPLRPDDWPPVRALAHGETVRNAAVTLNRFDGLRGNVLISAAPLHDAHGAVAGAVWVMLDVG
jgi:PAS domain-containing protein